MTVLKPAPDRALVPYLSPLGALALSFGFAVGWGAFVMPGRFFLPVAGPLGTLIGSVAGSLAMCVIAWCYHILAVKTPGPGGAFAYANKAFGLDHGFVVSWFLCLAYIAVLWANATALVLLARYTLGDALQFGFHYTLAGFDVYLGEVLACVAAIVLAGSVCLGGKRCAARFQTALALVFVAGVAVCLVAAFARHTGGLASMAPAFSPKGPRAVQIIHILAMAPWALVGFEAITNSSGEFAFPVKRTFAILVAAIVVSSLVYAALALLPVLAMDGSVSWPDYLGALPETGIRAMPVFHAASRALGAFGVALMVATMLAAQFTGLVGALVATSRLMYAMAGEGVIPRVFGELDADKKPRNAILFITAISLAVPFFGRSVVSWPIDVSSIGAIVVYGYVAAAAFKTGSRHRSRLAGLAGTILAVVFAILLLVPNYLFGTSLATESYLLLAIWCILGFLAYRAEFRKDSQGKFGHSSAVWISLIVMIFFSSLMWIRQATHDVTEEAIANIARAGQGTELVAQEMSKLNTSVLRNSIVEMSLLVVTLSIMMSLFAVLKRREREMALAKAHAEEVNRSKSYFFSTVSHDIRTPLNAIVGFSQMLKSGFKTQGEHDEAVDSILVSSKTLLSLINDVLDLSKLESGRMTIEPEPTDCRALLNEIVKSFRVANKRPDTVEIRGCIGEMPPLLIDPQRVRQIAFNLVGNAAKFTKEGFIEIRASFTRNPDPYTGMLRIDVEDTGCGISEEDLKKIASPYVQVGSKASRNGGTGLGLAICRQLAFAMGGKPLVTSTLGKGSTFSLVLPSVEICEMPAPAEEAPAPVPAGEATARAAIRRILVVDDQKMNQTVLKAMLRKLGDYELFFANNGKEALDILLANAPDYFDLVLTDMWMPEMNGEALVRAIRDSETLKDLRVYVLTADVEAQASYAELGFTGLLLKPVTLDKLKGIVT